MAAEPLLKVEDVHVAFGGLKALDGVQLDVPPGIVYGLIGPNGSGKTTLFNVITGFLRPQAGSVMFDGRTLNGLAPHQIARRGLCRTFQASLQPRRMTVMENMLLAPQGQDGERIADALFRYLTVRSQERAQLERARELLSLVKLGDKADEYAGSLSGGQRKLLALAQALMAKPRLILLDEPVAGVNPRLIEDILDVIERLRQQGQDFLIVEHNMKVVRQICDRVTVLDAGRVLADGPADEVLQRDDVLRAYLGRRTVRGAEPAASD